jgi:thiamine-phosphate pyrophosphorylase
MRSPLLYGILDLGYVARENVISVAQALVGGGVDLLQLRAKEVALSAIREVAVELVPICRAAGIPFILNDHVDLAVEVSADGVHLGQDDGSLAKARARLSRTASSRTIVGRSTHSLEQARAALVEGADYIGFGPLFPTPTKAGRAAIGLKDIAAMERDVGSRIPAFCIGGIHPGNLSAVLAAGARRCVIVSALLQSQDVEATTANVKSVLRVQMARCSTLPLESGESGSTNRC